MGATAAQRDEAPPRRVEMLAGLSVAIDLGLGQPAEHMLRSAIIGCRLADRLGLSREERATVYYTTLVMWIGCHADSQEYARWFGDDIAVRRDAYLIDWSGLSYLRFLLANVARGEPVPRRLQVLAVLLGNARGHLTAMIHSHCSSAAALVRHLGLPVDVEQALAYAFERFDGGGLPLGRSGTELPLAMRVAQVADVAEVHQRSFGIEGAVAMAQPPGRPVRPRGGGHLAHRPGGSIHRPLKCPFAVGHSRGVATRAAGAAEALGLPEADLRTLRRAGHLHDVGRLGVSNQVWSKSGELTVSQWERVRMHPYLTDRVLSRIPGLNRERVLARSHHEHLDGSGYPLGLAGMALGPGERILATAVAYQSALEPRPYRAALDPDSAATRLRRRAALGQLDPTCVDALLSTTGTDTRTVRRDDTLTPREREVLGLVARGLSNRQIAAALVLSEKTVRNHVERTYTKIGATNRVGASLYALEHGLVPVVPASAAQL